MCVYLIHADNGKHYLGCAFDLDARIIEHQHTTWERVPEFSTPDGRRKTGITHGNGATIIGVWNSNHISWSVIRIWKNKKHAFEKTIKRTHNTKRFCSICNPNGFQNGYNKR